MTSCNRCRRSTTLRPLQVGDSIAGPRTASPPWEAGQNTSTNESNGNQASARGSRGDVTLPADFKRRVNLLRRPTQTHIPIELRARIDQGKTWILVRRLPRLRNLGTLSRATGDIGLVIEGHQDDLWLRVVQGGGTGSRSGRARAKRKDDRADKDDFSGVLALAGEDDGS